MSLWRVGALGVLLAAAMVVLLLGASSALAYSPSTAPYATNDSGFTTAMQNVGHTPAPPDPTVPGLTYPAEWNAGADAVATAEQAGRFLPALESLGTLALGASAFDLGWQIGSSINKWFDISGNVGSASPGTGVPTSPQWKWRAVSGTFLGASDASLAPGFWYINLPGNIERFTHNNNQYSGSSDYHQYIAWADAMPGTRWQASNFQSYCPTQSGPPNTTDCFALVMTQAQMRAAVQMTPITSGAYAALPNHVSTTYSPPTPTSGDRAAARAALGNAVAGKNTSGQYVDSSGAVLSPAQVVAQVDINCQIDSTYCAGGTNDPTAPGSALSGYVTVPSCAGLLYAACASAITAAGFVPAPVRTTLDIGHADLTKPADAVVTTSPAPSTLVDPVTTVVTITANPNPLPVVIPAPLAHETYSAYIARLVALGLVGTITEHDLTGTTLNPALGPQEVDHTSPAVSTRVLPSSAIDVYANPADAPGPGTGGSAPTGPTLPGFSIPSAPTPCNVFPFGIPCWVATQLGTLSASAVAPSFSIGLPAIAGGSSLTVNLDHPFGADLSAIMSVVRVVLLFMSFIGLVLWLGGMAMGGSTGGGGSSEAEE